jgi:cytoskeletal protein RodZ
MASKKRLVPLNTVALSSDPTDAPKDGDFYYNTTSKVLKYYDASVTSWKEVGPTGPTGPTGPAGAVAVTYSSTPPESPAQGDVWIDSSTGVQYTYVNDGDSLQWVELSASGFVGPTGPTGPPGSGQAGPVVVDTGTAEPEDPTIGQLFFNTDTLTLKIFYGTWLELTTISNASIDGGTPETLEFASVIDGGSPTDELTTGIDGGSV